MENRVKIKQDNGEWSLTMLAFKDDAKQRMLILWIVLFSICGIAIFSQFFGNYSAGTKIFFGVYIAFWLFFEFKVVYAYRWRKYGLEYLTVEENDLILTKQIGKRGITQKYDRSKIVSLRLFENGDTDFIKSMTTSYWNINKYALAFDFEDKVIPFGIDLDEKQANRVLKALRNELEKKKN